MSTIMPDVRARIEELRSRITQGGILKGGLLGQGIAAGGGVGARGIKIFGQEEGKRPLEQVVERVRGRIEEFRTKWIPKPSEGITPPGTTPPETTTAGAPVKTYTAKIKTY